MPGKIKVKILAGRNLPVMDRSGDTTDAYVELKFGTLTYKTDVCRKSLNPQWNSEWYRFEVDDAELQDEPLQIRLMDHDTYSANDAIGKVWVNLNPLLLPGGIPNVKNMWTLEAAVTNTGQSGSVMTGWIPVYDTMHGIRGEVNIIVKVELFSDFNKFRQSSCGVQFFYSPNIPYGYQTQSVHGFVEELIVSDDPEYKWIDKIRTPRASNEARQTLFFKLSGEVQRKIGLKALDLGGNAVIGYLQNFDLEGESGIVARGIGTAVTLVKSQDILCFPSENQNIEEPSSLISTHTSNPIFQNTRRCHRFHPRSPRHHKKVDNENDVRKENVQDSPKFFEKFPVSYPLSSESVVQDESVRMMLALEDIRGEYNKNKLKSLKKMLDSEMKSSNPILNFKPGSSRSSIVSISSKDRVLKNEPKIEGIAALLIKSIHTVPLDNVVEHHENVSLKNDEEPSNTKEENIPKKEEEGKPIPKRKLRSGSSSEGNTPSSDNEFSDDFSNDSARYDILKDSNLSIDEEKSRFLKTLTRAVTFPPPKSKNRDKFERIDSDTRPLHEDSTFSLAKCMSAQQISSNLGSSLSSKLIFLRKTTEEIEEDNLQEEERNPTSNLDSVSESQVKENSENVTSKTEFQKRAWHKVFYNHRNSNDSDFSFPLATSTPDEIRPPFFSETLKSSEEEKTSGKVLFSSEKTIDEQMCQKEIISSEKTIPELRSPVPSDVQKSVEEKKVPETLLISCIQTVNREKYLKDEIHLIEESIIEENDETDNINDIDKKDDDISYIDETEASVSAYSLLHSASDFDNISQAGISDRLYSTNQRLKPPFKNLDELKKDENPFTNSTHSLPSLQFSKVSESRDKSTDKQEESKTPSSIESLLQSSNNDLSDVHKNRQIRMLDLIKIIDTKMMEPHHNKMKRRKRDRIYKNLHHQFARRNIEKSKPDFTRVYSIPKDLSLNSYVSRTPESSYRSSLESIIRRSFNEPTESTNIEMRQLNIDANTFRDHSVNTNTANITDNVCVSRPCPNNRQQDECVSPCYPLMVSSQTKVSQSATSKQTPIPLHRRSSDSDLSITPKGNSLGTSDRSVTGVLKPTAAIRTMNQDALEMLEYPFITMQQYPPGFIIHIGGLVSSRSVKLLERISNLEEPEGRDAWWKEIRMEVRSHARALACNVVIGYREETSICDDVCVLNAYGTAAVINLHTQDADSVFLKGQSDPDKPQKPAKSEIEAQPKVRHMSESKDPDTQFQTKCNLCHLPYNETSVPFRVNVSKCSICRRSKVPDIMFTTIEIPENMPTAGRGCMIHATVCKNKKDLRAELNAKEISDCLPFLEYELHSLLLNKLKVKGMNAIFGLKLQVSVGERLVIGMAVGTAVFLTALPHPTIPQIASGNSWNKEEQLADIRKTLSETVRKNREFYRLKNPGDTENGRLNSDTDESDEELPDLDFGVGTRDTCVLEVDDIEDMDRISLLMDDRPPDDFHVVNTQSIPGLDELEIVRNLQMFTQISRAKITPGQLASMPSKYFAKLLQSVYFKLRRMVPCALCDMQFKLALPEPDEIQFTVIGMALGLGDPVKINKSKKKIVSHSVSKEQVKKSDDSDMMFNLEVDHSEVSDSSTTIIGNSSTIIGNSNNTVGNLSNLTTSISGLKSRPRSPLTLKMHPSHLHKHVPLKGRYGVDITPLSYLPGGRIERYLGNLNFFFIRESTSIRENGGLSGFTHSFVMEVLAIVRAHITALGGNAMVAFFMTKCVLLHSPHKNQGQCLINVGGDVVTVSYFADEKHNSSSNC